MSAAANRKKLEPPRKRASLALGRCVGYPRTVLLVGSDVEDAAAIVRERGARFGTMDSPVPKEGFDLALIGGACAEMAEPLALLKQVYEKLGDGSHAIVTLPPAGERGAFNRDNGVKIVEDAGLEVMRVEERALAPVYVRFVQSLHSLLARKQREESDDRSLVVARKSPKPGKLRLTVGMLTLNEEMNVEKMIDDIREVAPDAEIFIVDSSSDKTPDLARAKGAKVFVQLPARGHGPAMERLMYETAAGETDALIYIDCDFTYPTAAIKRVRELLESGADVVNASRTHHYPKEMPIPNFIANRVFAATAQIVHGIPTTDVHSGMRGYRCSVIRAFDFDGEGDALPLDTLILPAKSHYHIAEVPIPYFKRIGVSKLAKLRATVWTFGRIASAIGEGSRVRRGVRYRHVDD